MQLVNMWDQIMVQILAQCMTMITMPIFWVIALLLAVQVGLIEIKKQKQVVGKLPAFLFAIIERWVCIIISGILGGVIASTLFLLTGISLAYDTVLYLWMIMFFFFMIKRRFFCFAYAGGALVLVQAIANRCGITMFHFDSETILALVAILHFTEAILIQISGTLLQLPVYFRNEKGILTAKSQLQMCWPIPLVIPMPVLQDSMQNYIREQSVGYYVMPDWWPLFGTAQSAEVTALYYLMPLLAMIGYSDLAEPRMEKTQTNKSALLLILYSMLLFLLVWVSSRIHSVLVVAALFSILGHEAILRLGQVDMRKYVHTKKE